MPPNWDVKKPLQGVFAANFQLSTGWIVTGHFSADNMGQSFGGFTARHKDNPQHEVFGDYQDGGVYSENKDALERFDSDHPPHQCD